MFPIGYCVSWGSRSRRGSGKIVNLINSQQTYVLDGGKSSRYVLKQHSHLAWIEASDSHLPVEPCPLRKHAARASFPVSDGTCPSKCQVLLHSRPPKTPQLDETLAQTCWFSLGRRESQIYSPGAGQGDQYHVIISHLIYNSATYWVCFVLKEHLFPVAKSSSARCQSNELFSHMIASVILAVPVFHFTPALTVVGLDSRKRKSMKYLQQYPFYFSGQPIIRIWQPQMKMKAKYLYHIAQKNLQSKWTNFKEQEKGAFKVLSATFLHSAVLE